MRSLKEHGFTLLEILIALTIVGTALASLIAMFSQSRQLAFRSRAELQKSVAIRSVLNSGQLADDTTDILLPDAQRNFSVQTGKILPRPERQTKPLSFALEEYHVVGPNGAILLGSVHWKKLDLPK